MAKSKFRAEIEAASSAFRVLAVIDAWSKEAPIGDVKDLWNILSALRGPDREAGFDVKNDTTARLRSQVLPNFVYAVMYDENADGKELDTALAEKAGNHFAEHIRFAKQALENQRKKRAGRKAVRQ